MRTSGLGAMWASVWACYRGIDLSRSVPWLQGVCVQLDRLSESWLQCSDPLSALVFASSLSGVVLPPFSGLPTPVRKSSLTGACSRRSGQLGQRIDLPQPIIAHLCNV